MIPENFENTMQSKIPSYVFAGGHNRRMNGIHKAFLEFDGQKSIDLILANLKKTGFSSIKIVTNNRHLFSHMATVEIIEDRVPDQGPMGALYTVLEDTPTNMVFCVACDMPYFDRTLVANLLKLAEHGEYDCVVPVSEHGIEPLFALYSKTLIPALRESINQDKRSLHRFIQTCNAKYLDLRKHGYTLCNINTPDEYQAMISKKNGEYFEDSGGQSGCH